jgi:hypothetical protein
MPLYLEAYKYMTAYQIIPTDSQALHSCNHSLYPGHDTARLYSILLHGAVGMQHVDNLPCLRGAALLCAVVRRHTLSPDRHEDIVLLLISIVPSPNSNEKNIP